jgi:hypothetical protein
MPGLAPRQRTTLNGSWRSTGWAQVTSSERLKSPLPAAAYAVFGVPARCAGRSHCMKGRSRHVGP